MTAAIYLFDWMFALGNVLILGALALLAVGLCRTGADPCENEEE